MDVIQSIRERAKSGSKKIVLPEVNDERVIKATAEILKEGIANVVLLGNADEIKKSAKYLNVDIEKAEIVDITNFENMNAYVTELVKLREKKGMTPEKAKEILSTDRLYFGAMMVRFGDVDGMVAGSIAATADVLRASIQIIGSKPGIKTLSSCFLMVLPEEKKEFGEDGVMIFSDCGVVPNPTSEQLVDIAIGASESARIIANIDPKVALLSFSTKGSAKHADVTKVEEAVELLKAKDVDFSFDGSLQADAAIVESVGAAKAPGSDVAGKANVLVFPDLDAANIGYKLVQRLAGAQAMGPLLQGFAKPVNDLSRGCSVEDIVNVVAITSCSCEDTNCAC